MLLVTAFGLGGQRAEAGGRRATRRQGWRERPRISRESKVWHTRVWQAEGVWCVRVCRLSIRTVPWGGLIDSMGGATGARRLLGVGL
eukprot:COSAG02_NODE_56_length_43700_cov_33.650765_16_plen_87_part_00